MMVQLCLKDQQNLAQFKSTLNRSTAQLLAALLALSDQISRILAVVVQFFPAVDLLQLLPNIRAWAMEFAPVCTL
jgi:hypothetical protein